LTKFRIVFKDLMIQFARYVDSNNCGRILCNVCRQSYDVDIELSMAGSGVTSSNTLDLKNPCFRYTGQPVQAPPGINNTSPTDAYWASVQDASGTTSLWLFLLYTDMYELFYCKFSRYTVLYSSVEVCFWGDTSASGDENGQVGV